MAITDLYRRARISSRLIEEELYAEAVREIEHGVRRDGLWAKAYAKCGGNKSKAKALYIEFRVQSLKDEMAIYELNLRSGQKSPLRTTCKEDAPATTSTKMEDREERIKSTLRQNLGREPTESEISAAKWDGLCLDN